MRKRLYTEKELTLGFNSKVLTFNDQILTFYSRGLTYFDVEGFTYTEAEMGEATINLDMFVEPSLVPEFSRFWYVDYRGERYYLSTLTPTCVKDTSSLRYKYTLIFKSQRADLERYEFADFVSASSTVTQPISYSPTLALTVQGFVERFNTNLNYYFGAGVWQMVLNSTYMDNINTTIYNGTDTVTTSFSRETLWSLLTGLYDIYGLRWKISSIDGIMTITLGYTPDVIDHIFEYGKDKGLISIERTNSSPKVYTRLSGRGSDKNLPYRYFDSATADYIQDPDHNEYTETIPYTNLMTKSYRDYVKGWNDASIGSAPESSLYAYSLGYTDKQNGNNFNPVDYVHSESAEEFYGIRKGSVADNSDIYPTFQDTSTASLGYLDEVIAVEQVLNDDYDSTDASLNRIVTEAVTYSGYERSASMNNTWSLKSSQFQASSETDILSFIVTLDVSSSYSNTFTYDYNYTVEVVSAMGTVGETVVNSSTFSVANASTSSLSQSFLFPDEFGLGESDFNIRVTSYFKNDTGRQMFYEQGITAVTLRQKISYEQTFDIWIKNIWDSTFQDIGHESETEDDYMHRIWDPLIAPNVQMTVMFSSGLLAGDYEFLIAVPSDSTNYYIYHDESESLNGIQSHWRLGLIKSDANLESTKLMLPNMTINASAGDKFFLTNIEMPYYPYVYQAEQRLEAYLATELDKTDTENPTYSIKPSAVFLELNSSINNSIKIGSMARIFDNQIFGNIYVNITITNLTIQYKTGVLLPEWNITIADEPTSNKNSIQIIQGDVKVLSGNLLSAQQLTEQIELQLDSRYLRKDGEAQTSASQTTFTDTTFLDGTVRSTSYLQGQMGGYGYSLYKDANSNYVFEIDKLSVRKTLTVNELIINQVSIYGGIHVYSAAAMTISNVDSSNSAYDVCYLDIKGGTVLNQFVAGDHAYCQRFNPESNELIKYYWREVVLTGDNFIAISKTGGDGDSIPAIGDNVAQLGNNSNIARQSALIIDQINGGTVTQYAKINAYTFENKDYIRYGVDPLTGKAYERIYGDFYAGGRNKTTDNYINFDSSTGKISYRGTITQDSTVVDSGGNESAITVYRGVYNGSIPYYVGNTVSYLGSTYYCDAQTTAGISPTNTSHWHVVAAKGETGNTGADGTSGISIICDKQSLSVTPTVNAFSASVTVRLASGVNYIPTTDWAYDITPTGVTVGSVDNLADGYRLNLTGFTASTVSLGYIEVDTVYGGTTFSLSISVARVFNPVNIAKGTWTSGTSYTGNCFQRDVVKYTDGIYYAVKTSIGSTSTTWVSSEWQALNSFSNVATEVLFADQANIAGFIYKDGQMISQAGTIAGIASTDWMNSSFIPNLKFNGSTGSMTAAGGRLKALSDGTFAIEFTTTITRYTPSGGSTTIDQTLSINNTTGIISIATSDSETAYMTSQGILANKAGTQALPGSTGVTLKSSIVGLGQGNLAATAYDSLAAICGVYGDSYNSNSSPAPSYGGYFRKLKASGLYITTESVEANYTCTDYVVFISCYNNSGNNITITLPISPYAGRIIYIRSNNTGSVTISGNGKSMMAMNGTLLTSTDVASRGDLYMLLFDGSYWLLNII